MVTRQEDLVSPDSARESALRQLVAAAVTYARATHAGTAARFPTTRLFVCVHEGAGEAIVRDDIALALCPACAVLYTAGRLRFANSGQLFLAQGD